jgi:hypothetical protein
VPHGFRKTVGDATVDQPAGNPSTRRSNVSTMSPWLRTVASTDTAWPAATQTDTAAPASSASRAGSRSVSNVETRGAGGSG